MRTKLELPHKDQRSSHRSHNIENDTKINAQKAKRNQLIMSEFDQLNELVERVQSAQKIFATYSQEQVDRIFRAAALAAADARIPLAKMAAEESGMGVIEDKVIKNHFAAEYIYNKYKDYKTCGILEVDDDMGIIVLAEPLGTICGVVPCTNPTSTTIFKVRSKLTNTL
jgi:acetaldehyde dehydrogenase/alcohol dehydrogenase